MEVIRFPDAEGVAVAWLNEQLPASGSDATASQAVPNPRPPYGFVTVQRTGGPKRNLVTDSASLTFDCWADTGTNAYALADLVRALVNSWQGRSADGVTVSTVAEFAGPAYLPDPASKSPRYRFTATVAMRGTPSH